MTYGRRFSRGSVVRRGPRPRLRTRRVGYPTGKAFLRRRTGVKRRMPVLLAPRPIKRRKVIQTRSTIPPRIRSPFKVQREVVATNFRTNAVTSLVANQIPEEDAQLFSLALSPKAGVGISPDRAVEGSKGRYVGCNIVGSIMLPSVNYGTIHFRVMVVQAKNPQAFPNGTIKFSDDTNFTAGFWKTQEYNDAAMTYQAYNGPTYQVRKNMAINTDRYKVLRMKYITCSDRAGHTTAQGFHFYIPMQAQLDDDRKITCQQFANNRTSTALANVDRYAYFNPVFLLIEPVMHTTESHAGSDQIFAGLDIDVKHTFRDAI